MKSEKGQSHVEVFFFLPLVIVIVAMYFIITNYIPKPQVERINIPISSLENNDYVIAFNSLKDISVEKAYILLKMAIPTVHFTNPCHHKNCNSEEIKEKILTISCNPVEVYFCPEPPDRNRLKFICPAEDPNIYYGLSLGIDPKPEFNFLPFEITAFPEVSTYWKTSVAPCTLIGIIVHP
jgi:hypothetical protein